MKRLQVYLPESLLESLRLYAQSRGIPLAEAIRQAGKEFSSKPVIKKQIKEAQLRKKKSVKNPFIAMAGMLGRGPTNASMTVDDIYDD
ncbi:hypothetical protein A2960_02570 [Candidatus Gottesmanbacteria bacterium RIFCSPLOWO2_01_FULL_39_12b]|uniref:CopG-like ribbon-helix-helix domain-containing protein n=1 Tax=Candidatus Gottesmanbacteria bacterium RIFCSPLOWO2_01_FULL_39_12b TaxID=1798388 RepID=A0A1F6AQN8_9BACT|nr:MAG: hypothetical protein A2960_02570 [Candidatus Gottesmanbacteria bacterium RIFCSPLOWO2_01_FULL_39_12b]